MFLKEYKDIQDRLAFYLPWGYMVEPGILINKNGSLQATFSFRGEDLDSSTTDELISSTAKLNNILKRMDGDWTFHCEAKRYKSKKYDRSLQIDEIPVILIENERQRFFESGHHYESEYYFTLTFLPPKDTTKKFLDIFIVGKSTEDGINYKEALKIFKNKSEDLFLSVQTIFAETKWLTDKETLTYLHGTVSDRYHQVKVPEIPLLLDSFITDTPLLGGLEPKLGEKYLKVISLDGFPGTSIPGILDNLNRLNIEYRWVTRFIALDKQTALNNLKSYHRKWFAGRKSFFQLIKEVFTNNETVHNLNRDALNKAEEVAREQMFIQSDGASLGFYTCAIVLEDKNLKTLNQKAKEVVKELNGLEFTAHIETLNTIEAWLGSIPGNTIYNIRKPLINSLVLSHLLPVSAVWAGEKWNKHLDKPPLLYTQTSGNTPFRLNLHQGDVGHTMLVGMTGSGKSVHLAVLAAQFKKYERSQVYTFDKGGSSRVLTKAVGGEFYDLGSDELTFQPLAKVDIPSEKEFALEWLEGIFVQEKLELDPKKKEVIWNALTDLENTPKEQRTLTSFQAYLQDEDLRRAIKPYTNDGPYGKYFDSSEDNLSYGKWQVFEMEKIAEKKQAITPTLSYLFHRIETDRLNGDPTLIILDECWLFFDNPQFEAKIREWLKVLRKKNASVVFATQELNDIAKSSISETVKNACQTKIFLPNPKAKESSEIYREFGLNDREIEILSLGTLKQDYYYKSPLGCRLYQLGLSQLELAYVATSGETDQQAAKRLIHLDTKEFNIAWLNYKGLDGEKIIREMKYE